VLDPVWLLVAMAAGHTDARGPTGSVEVAASLTLGAVAGDPQPATAKATPTTSPNARCVTADLNDRGPMEPGTGATGGQFPGAPYDLRNRLNPAAAVLGTFSRLRDD